jgi:hypothetical protein
MNHRIPAGDARQLLRQGLIVITLAAGLALVLAAFVRV